MLEEVIMYYVKPSPSKVRCRSCDELSVHEYVSGRVGSGSLDADVMMRCNRCMELVPYVVPVGVYDKGQWAMIRYLSKQRNG